MVEQPAFAFPELVEGRRLRLRPWEQSDAGPLTDLITSSLDHLRPFMPFVMAEPMGPEDRAEIIAKWRRDFTSGTINGVYAICLDDAPIGSCGLHRRGAPNTLEIGYWVGVAYLRQGFATDAAGLLTNTAFQFPEIDKVEIHHDQANVASSGVPRKLGYVKTSEAKGSNVAPGETGREWVWTMTREAWVLTGRRKT